MLEWSTDELPQRDRFEAWREERARRIYGVEIELNPEQRKDFQGRLRALRLGQAAVVELEVTPYFLDRTQRAIDRVPADTFSIWQLRQGRGVMLDGSKEYNLDVGAICSGWDDLPYSNRPLTQAPVGCRMVKIDGSVLSNAGINPTSLAPCHHAGAPGLDALFRSYLQSFFENVQHLTGSESEHAVQALGLLALGARGMIDTRGDAGAVAVRHGLLVEANRLIEQNLGRSDLTPSYIAGLLGISVRKLHLVFEPSGQTFSRSVLNRRLARADRLLQAAPHLSISQVAYASGFESLPTFFRCYKAAYGLSPGDRRRGNP